ncbi:hypothetical protein [Thalassotalea ganghwensis]
MLDKNIRCEQVSVNEKVIMTGFSASGTFANRFSLMHPDALKLVVGGGLNGILLLPVNALDKQTLDYPLGINDIEKTTGQPFSLERWQALPQFLFMGAKDTNDAAEFDDSYSDVERQVIYSTMGKNMQPDRWQRCQDMYVEHHKNVVFRTYADIGHGTNLAIHNEILAFVKDNI